MEMYKKPVMDIIDLERIDVLTTSGYCSSCGDNQWYDDLESHNSQQHSGQSE
jgi:hypothetical protein